METINIIHTVGVCVLMICALVYRHKYLKKAAEVVKLQYSSDAIRDFWKHRYEVEWENHQATKAELEQYKNHESET